MMVVHRYQHHIWFSHLLKSGSYGFLDPASHLIRTHLSRASYATSYSDCIDELAINWLSKEHVNFEKLPVAVQRKVLQRQLFSKSIESSFDLVESLRTQVDQAIEVSPGKRLSRKKTGKIEWLPLMNERVFLTGRCEIDLFGQNSI